MKLLKSTVFAVVMVFISILVVSAADFKVYPGAKVDEKLTKEANDYGAKAAAGSRWPFPRPLSIQRETHTRRSILTTRVLARNTRCQVSGTKNKLPSGKELKSSFFIFDGVNDLMSSKLWQRFNDHTLVWI